MEWGSGGRRLEIERVTLGALILGVTATALVALTPEVRFAYRNPELHLVLETGEGLIALLIAYLMWGRFKRRGRTADLVLVYALSLLGLTNLVLSVLPDVVDIDPQDVTLTWAAVAARATGGMALAVAALTPARFVREVATGWRTLVMALGGTLALVLLATDAFASSLPAIVESDLAASASGRPSITSHPSFTVVQSLSVLPYALAAWGFLARHQRTGDDLMRWLSAGAVLSAFARVQYALYPSLYSRFVYTGDLLRLSFYLLLLLGAAREIRSHWASRAQAAALEERRRLASDLHDGIAQEMTFLAGQVARLRNEESPRSSTVARLQGATERAVAEARRAIAALQGPLHQPLDAALRDVALQIFPDEHPRLDLRLAPGVDLAPGERERLVRVTREALLNASKHAAASLVTLALEVEDGAIIVRVIDDGGGFDPDAATDGFGITMMRERTRAMGGVLSVVSRPGEGSTVEVRLR